MFLLMSARLPPRLRFALFYAAAWSPLLVLNLASATLMQRQPLLGALGQTLSLTSIAAALGLPVWFLSEYLERAHASRGRTIAAYLAASAVYAVVLSLTLQLIDPMRKRPVSFDAYHLITPLLLFGIQLLAILAVQNFARAEQSRRAADAAEKARIAAESMRARAELQALRAHLDPHFLFNTLNAIAAVVETDSAKARQMLVRAGALLRRVLDLGATGRDAVTVAEEWGIVSEYLSFERLRMGDRLRVDAAISDDAMDCEIPAFILQPLVENAIRHGLFPQPSGGTLTVRGAVDGETLRLEVSDTGGGAAVDAIDGAAGFGLRAARQRLVGAYGTAARVDVTTSPGHGFRVTLALPSQLRSPSPAALDGRNA
jgi:signal transduction histidine kinase